MQTNNDESSRGTQIRNLLTRLWSLWTSLFDRLPDWIFAPEAEPPPLPPQPEDPNFEEEFESYKLSSEQRKAYHDETSKTIRRVFYSLVGACMFCVITLAGSPDVQLLTSGATVKLPALNYDIEFKAFLVVGPVFLIALTIYLHIFVGQHRMVVMSSESQQPMLPNFNSWTARLMVLVISYWMVPITLVVFTWKAWPRPYGPLLGYTALGVATGLVLLQIRRCPRKWRGWGLPLLAFAFAIFYQQFVSVTINSQLNLFKADLSEQDLRTTNLSNAFFVEANLSGANLSGANLSGADLLFADLTSADLSGANLSGANLSGVDLLFADLTSADLSEADLTVADLSGADLSGADLSEADLSGADLLFADLTGADLSSADLSEADLSGADLLFTDLSEADLSSANLSSADLSEADLSGANLSGANLHSAKVVQGQLQQTCGDDQTILPEGLIINPCSQN
jgi:uncharacterized protein YjbI with pentapeptide repeats